MSTKVHWKPALAVLMALAASWFVRACTPAAFHGLAVLSPREAMAQPTIDQNKGGLGAYAVMAREFPCQVLMRAFKEVPTLRLSFLWNTFGNNWQCLEQFVADPRPKLLEVHLINEVCQRNKRCGKYEVLYGLSVEQYRTKLLAKDAKLLGKIKQNVAPLVSFLAAKPEVECLLTAGLESNLPAKAYKNLVTELKPMFPERCRWGWSPVGRNSFGDGPIDGFFYEAHGDSPPGVRAPCIVNLDGVDIHLKARRSALPLAVEATVLPRFLASFASCDAAYLWIAEFNGNGRGSFIDPRKRTNWPTAKMADELRSYLRRPVESLSPPAWAPEDDAAKAGCKTFLKISDGAKKDFLWKQSEPAVLNRGAVVFLPRKYNEASVPLKSVYVMKRSKRIASAYEQKRYTEDGSNRQFFRFHKLAEDFPFNVVVHFGTVCAVIPNPKVRND